MILPGIFLPPWLLSYLSAEYRRYLVFSAKPLSAAAGKKRALSSIPYGELHGHSSYRGSWHGGISLGLAG